MKKKTHTEADHYIMNVIRNPETGFWEVHDQVGYLCTVEYENAAHVFSAATDLLDAARCALADLEGIMPEFEPSGDREHPAWATMQLLRKAIEKAEPSAG